MGISPYGQKSKLPSICWAVWQHSWLSTGSPLHCNIEAGQIIKNKFNTCQRFFFSISFTALHTENSHICWVHLNVMRFDSSMAFHRYQSSSILPFFHFMHVYLRRHVRISKTKKCCVSLNIFACILPSCINVSIYTIYQSCAGQRKQFSSKCACIRT